MEFRQKRRDFPMSQEMREKFNHLYDDIERCGMRAQDLLTELMMKNPELKIHLSASKDIAMDYAKNINGYALGDERTTFASIMFMFSMLEAYNGIRRGQSISDVRDAAEERRKKRIEEIKSEESVGMKLGS